ncbi:MAG: hypothetical protein ACYST5_08540 [Planctomycetota bacterium]
MQRVYACTCAACTVDAGTGAGWLRPVPDRRGLDSVMVRNNAAYIPARRDAKTCSEAIVSSEQIEYPNM